MLRKLISRLILPWITATGPAAAVAVEVDLVVDLNQAPVDYSASVPSGFVAAGRRTLFTLGFELSGGGTWSSDGTAAGTGLLAEFCDPIACGSTPLGSVGRHALLVTSDGFSSGGAFRSTVWSTRGTAADAQPLVAGVSLVSGLADSGMARGYLVTANRDTAGHPVHRLWRTDGTQSGTQVIAEFQPEEVSEEWSIAHPGNLLFLVGRDESWASDGTPAGTQRLPVLIDSVVGVAPFQGGAVFSGVAAGASQSGLWRSDGTPGGTQLLSATPGAILDLAVVGNQIVFVLDDVSHGQQLRVSDGSATGARRVSDYSNPRAFNGQGHRRLLFPVGDRLLFLIDRGQRTHAFSWWKPGLAAPRRLLGCAGGCPQHVAPSPLSALGQRLAFLDALDPQSSALAATDGTAAGTGRLGVTVEAPFSGTLRVAGAKLFFRSGSSLWVSDGTTGGTRALLASDALLFWVGQVGTQWWIGLPNAVWRTDGTVPGTQLVKSPLLVANGSSSVVPLADLGNAILFCDIGQLLAMSLGGAPQALAPFPDACGRPVQAPELGRVFFRVIDGGSPRWWGSDGTPSGTAPLPPPTAFADSTLLDLAHWSGATYAIFGDGGTARLFRLDRSGWVPLFFAAAPDVGFVPPDFTGSDLLLFDAQGLWQVAPQAAAAAPIAPQGSYWSADLGSSAVIYGNAGYERCSALGGCTTLTPLAGQPLGWRTSGGRLFVVATGSADSLVSLWRIDADGTIERLPAECVAPGVPPPGSSILTALGGCVLMACGSLWVSDGTAAGTSLLLDAQTGGSFVAAGPLSPLGEVLVFSGYDIGHGEELWQTDGTPAGTHLAQDINPGPGSSAPDLFRTSNGLVYFSAWDPVHGRELRVARP